MEEGLHDTEMGETMRECKEHDDLGCPMTRINRTRGVGPSSCDIMLIGEAPGKTEDKKGTPFEGKSGSELTHLYLAKCAQIGREHVYITNLVKCWTNDKDRDPNPAEIEACSQILWAEIQEVKPRFIGTIGRIATQFLISPNAKMEKLHGFGYTISINFVDKLIMPLYHPAYGLHSTSMMTHIMRDFVNFGKMVRGDESVMWRERV